MITEAVVILLVVLILANLLISVINYVSPPYKNNVTEYLQSAKQLPDGRMSSLGSIPSGTDVDYVGLKVESDDKGNYILKSRNEDYERSLDGMKSVSYNVSKDEDMEMLKDSLKSNSKFDKSAIDAVSKALDIKTVEVEERKRVVNKFGDNANTQQLAMLETEFEGIGASNRTPGRMGTAARPSEMSLSSERDGYH